MTAQALSDFLAILGAAALWFGIWLAANWGCYKALAAYKGPRIADRVAKAAINWSVFVVLFGALASQSGANETWHDAIVVPDTQITDVMTADLTEAECMALNLYHEIRDGNEYDQRLVAQTVMDRIADRFLPNSACEVIRKAAAFEWTEDGKSDRPYNREAYRAAYLMGVAFLYMGETAGTPYDGHLLNYHNGTVSPNWHDMRPVIWAPGGHIHYVRVATYDR